MRRVPWAILAASVASLVTSLPAAAQERPQLDLRTWRPSTDPNASVVLEPAVTPGPRVLTFGAYGHYAFRPVTLAGPTGDTVAYRPLEHALGLDVFGNLGIGKRFAVGLSVPVLVYQTGSQPLPRSVSDVSSVPSSGFGDLGISLKGSILRNEQGGFGLAALGWVSAPTGDRSGFAGEGGATASARILAEYTLLVAVAQASLGYKMRTEHRTWPSAEAGGIRFGDEIPWSVALAVRPGVLGIDPGNRQRLEVGMHGWLPAGPVGPFGSGDPGSASLSPVQLALSDRIELGHYRDTFLTIGAEARITEAVGVPVFRGILGFGWSPRAHDLDGDGVKDDLDGCPEIPEDKDGFEDSDGCPEIDNDDDGIIDKEDACPNVKGVPSSDPKKNGCPGEPEATPPAKIPEPVVLAPDPCIADPSLSGCPDRDRDGDTFDNDVDTCPDAAETFNGVDDGDGCPDEGGKPLVAVDEKRKVRLTTPLRWVGAAALPDVDPSSVTSLRALVLELNRHPDWVVQVGARPATGEAGQADALAKSLAVVRVLSSLSHRDGIAETVGWDAVKAQPDAGGVAFVIVATTPAGGAPPSLPPAKP